jgi:lysophospholipase L1-like esterase
VTEPHKRTVRRKIGLASVAVFGVFLLCEVGFRCVVALTSDTLSFAIWEYRDLWYADFQPRLTYVPHPYLGYVHVDDGPDDEVNTHGFWGPERTLEKPEGTLRVACFGGSTTAGPLAWPYQLEQVLSERLPATTIQVDNYGLGGWTSAEAVSAMAHIAQSYAPDLLVVHSVNNDLVPMRRVSPAVDYSHYRRAMDALQPAPGKADLRATWTDRIDAVFVTVSNLYIYAKLWIVGPTPGRANLHKLTVWDGEETIAPSMVGVATYARNLRTLAALGEAIGAPMVVATMPSRPSPGDGHQELLADQNERMLALADVEGWTAVDLAALSGDMAPYFIDAIHVDETGAQMKAAAIADAVLEAQLLVKPSR